MNRRGEHAAIESSHNADLLRPNAKRPAQCIYRVEEENERRKTHPHLSMIWQERSVEQVRRPSETPSKHQVMNQLRCGVTDQLYLPVRARERRQRKLKKQGPAHEVAAMK
ncbi:hypothetical protein DL95DRAFT_76179 [Leptodontidium sp. 2 PMI_412]|nr:hypothetical protein DL95DRAFT_76179 [Leptodontidium sp. 2 PMI_412]